MSSLAQRLLASLKARAEAPGMLRPVWSLMDWRPATVRLPRHLCHFVTLEMQGVPARMLKGAIELQLKQLTGIFRIGFAFRAHEDRADVWYWNEALDEVTQLAGSDGAAVALWPESVLREAPADGLFLVACQKGFEGFAKKAGQLRRTRWFSGMPTSVEWLQFARDAGHAEHDVPAPRQFPMLAHASAGWKLHSAFQKPVSNRSWAVAGVAALLGSGVCAAGVYQVKLDRAIATEQATIARIEQENASTIGVQQRINKLAQYVDRLQLGERKVLQLGLMAEIAASGLIDEAGKTSVAEWEYRGRRLRLVLVVPQDRGSLEGFLERIEAIPSFTEVRLLPDSPANTIAVQMVVEPRDLPLEKYGHLAADGGDEGDGGERRKSGGAAAAEPPHESAKEAQ